MYIYSISLQHVETLLLIFLRVSAIMLVIPVFDSRNIPVILKVGLSFSISIILFSVIDTKDFPFVSELLPFFFGVASEIMIGIIIGLSVKLIFSGIMLAGQLNGIQMGFGLSRVIDPAIDAQVSIIGQFNNLVALLIFLTINAHHWFLRAIVESFTIVPPFDFQFSKPLIEQIIGLGGDMFIIAVKVAAPVMAALLLTSTAFALVARTVPQMNIMIVAMPVKIGVGLLFLGLILPMLIPFFRQIFDGVGKNILLLLKAM